MSFFWISQGVTFETEFKKGIIWATTKNLRHHKILREVKIDDIIVSYVQKSIVAVGIAHSKAYYSKSPNENIYPKGIGLQVDIVYSKLPSPIQINSQLGKRIFKLNHIHGPMNKNGTANQIYACEITEETFKLIFKGNPNNVEIHSAYNSDRAIKKAHFEEFLNFVKEHFRYQNKLFTLGGKAYFVKYDEKKDSLVYIPRTGKIRNQGKKWVNRVFDKYLQVKSYNTSDYHDITVNASYLLPIIKLYFNKQIAILFSADPSIGNIQDAINHLRTHKELYWEVGYNIDKNKFTFPLIGYIHIKKIGVKYRVVIKDIKPHKKYHYTGQEAYKIKPKEWIEGYNGDESWKSCYVFTRIEELTDVIDTLSIKKENGESITLAPQGYVRIIDPLLSEEKIEAPEEDEPLTDEKTIEEDNLDELGEAIQVGIKELRYPKNVDSSHFRDVGYKSEETSYASLNKNSYTIGKKHAELINKFNNKFGSKYTLEEGYFDVLITNWKGRKILIEAKTSSSGSEGRSQIRQSIGQLFDYKKTYFEKETDRVMLALLLPSKPYQEIIDLMKSLSIEVIWFDNDKLKGTIDL